MSTSSRIGIELPDGSILSAYHDSNSDPEWLGRVLDTYYNTQEKVIQLIDGGDMSSCWTDLRFDDSADGSYGPQYYSQRGEDCPPRLDVNYNEYVTNSEEYSYLFRDNQWHCYNNSSMDVSFIKEISIPTGSFSA